MSSTQQQSLYHDTPDYRLLSRGVYSDQPLYFFENPIRTASGNKWLVTRSLREIGSYVNYRPSPEGIRDYLCYGFVPAPRTIFKGVLAVPPGMSCHLSYHDDSISWQPLNHTIKSLSHPPEITFWQQLCQHVKTDSACLLLSGGLDSAMIAAAANASSTRLTAYHAHFSGSKIKEDSDTYSARQTASHLGLTYKEITINSFDALRYFNDVIASLDQPLGDPVILPFYLLFKTLAKQQAQTVVLTGEGSDQLFGSWSMKPMLMRELYPEANYQREHAYLASFHKFYDEWTTLISASLAQQLNQNSDLIQPIKQAFANSPSSDFCNQLRWVDLQLKGLQHILPRINTMANTHHLTAQHPFFQADMMELGIALPNDLKMTGARDKIVLKMLAHAYLPESVIERRKQGMGVPTSQWFRYGLRPIAMYWLNKNRLIDSGLLNPNTVQDIRKQTITASDGRGRRWGDRLWMLCALECWFASLQQR